MSPVGRDGPVTRETPGTPTPLPTVGRVQDEECDGLWYVAYGSNLCRDRLMAYLCGTVAPDRPGAAGGADRPGPASARFGPHRGGPDPTPPRADLWCAIDHRVTFRGRSRRWGGGVAFLDLHPTPGTATEARAWLLTAAQVVGLAGQEARLRRDPDPALLQDLGPPGSTVTLGGGWYDTLLRLPDLEGRRAVTVTTAQDLPATAPTPAYLATIEAGRAERPGRGGTSAAAARGSAP